VADLAFNIDVAPVATVREPDGLAMSSRNLRLSAEGRKKAVVFYKALANARPEASFISVVRIALHVCWMELSTATG
jgi:pantoate--beta-alanine ligase